MKWINDRFPLLIIWLCLLLAYIGLVFSNGPKSQYTDKPQASSKTYEQSEERQTPPPLVINVEQAPPAEVSQDKEDWETRDSKAQIQMMRAAWVAVGLTVLGLMLVGFTLHYTKKAARSATDSLDVARIATKAEFQPYILIKDPFVGL